MKKQLQLILALLLGALATTTYGQHQVGDEFTIDDIEYRVISRNPHKVEVSNYTGPGGELTIPRLVYFGTYAVTRIGNQAFQNKQLTSVTIPKGVTNIGLQAFWNNQLTEVTIPENVIALTNFSFFGNPITKVTALGTDIIPTIADHTFSNRNLIDLIVPERRRQIYLDAGWTGFSSVTEPPKVGDRFIVNDIDYRITSLTPLEVETIRYYGNGGELVIPENVDHGPNPNTYAVTAIGNGTFPSTQLTSVAIPEGVTRIGEIAFWSNQLTSVEIPNSVTSIGNQAFEHNALTSVTLGEGVTSIGNRVFRGNQLTSVEIPGSVTRIGGSAFADNQLTSVTLGEGVTSIGNTAFADNQLTSVEIPNSVTTIRDGVFKANNLISVEIPGSVTSIGNSAFADNQLTSVTLGEGVTSIGDFAFANNQITSIRALGNTPPSLGGDNAFQQRGNIDVAVPWGSPAGSIKTAYENHDDWTGFKSITEEAEINDTFEVDHITYSITSLTPNTVTATDYSTAGGLSVNIPQTVGHDANTYTVTAIGNNAFQEKQLTSVAIPEGVTSIGDSTFSQNDMTEVTIPENVTDLGPSAFASNPITKVTALGTDIIPTIADNTFPNRNLIDLIVPEGKRQAYLDAGWTGFSSVTEPPKVGTDILGFTFVAQTKAAQIDAVMHTVEIQVAFGTDVTTLTPTFTLSEGAISNISSGVAGDFTDPVTYRVTAEDGITRQDWRVTVTVGQCNNTLTAKAKDITVQLDANGQATITPEQLDNGSSYGCGNSPALSLDRDTFTCNDAGTPVTVTLTAAQGNNSATATALVTVEENPNDLMAIAKDITVQLDANGQVTISPDQVDNGSSSGCNNNPDLSLDRDTFDCSDVGTPVTVTLTVTQGNNLRTAIALVTVEENPNTLIAIAKDITVQLDANGQATITPEQLDNGSSYGCDNNPALSLDRNTFSCNDAGDTVTVTLTATQGNNSATATATVTVQENPNDLMAIAKDITVQLDANGQVTISPDQVNNGSSSGCNNNPDLSLDRDTFDCSDVGTPVTVTLTATQGNNSSTAIALVTVEENPNTLIAIAKDITVQLDANGQATITPEQLNNGSFYGCGGNSPNLSLDIDTFTCNDAGDTVTVTLTATHGNSSNTATALVTVENNINGLVAVAKDITVQLNISGQVTISPEDIDNGSGSGCNNFSPIFINLDRDTFTCDDVDSPVTVVLTATQGTNTVTATAMVTVEANGNCELGPLLVDFNRGISPNGDGIGDTLVIEGLEAYGNNVVMIYNLSQRLLFSAHYGGPSDAWNGTHKGGRVPVDSYVCVIDYNEPGLGHEAKMIYVNY